ncbi:MAG: hypothetical protein KC931_01290 [Candidatus Omnitrophica bacterium]|nr:hypothetical protein [Candidatus Omnitrophota bacterium]
MSDPRSKIADGATTNMKLKSIEESSIFEDLKDRQFAAEYLEDMLREDDFPSFLIALRNVAIVLGR